MSNDKGAAAMTHVNAFSNTIARGFTPEQDKFLEEHTEKRKQWEATLHKALRDLKIPFDPKHTSIYGFAVWIYTNDKGAPRAKWMLKKMGMPRISEQDGSRVSKEYPVLLIAKRK